MEEDPTPWSLPRLDFLAVIIGEHFMMSFLYKTFISNVSTGDFLCVRL